ncbi:MAG: beta-galactosidase [Kiritimatiellia bacterium]
MGKTGKTGFARAAAFVTAVVFGVAACLAPPLQAAVSEPVEVFVRVEQDRNLLRNGSFEFANRHNGMKTILNPGDHLAFQWGARQKQRWCETGFDQWWGEGPTNGALYAASPDACSGRRSLAVTAPGAITTWLVYLDDWPEDGADAVTLSWRAKGVGGAAALRAEVALHEGAAPLSQEPRVAGQAIDGEADAGTWGRGTLTFEIPAAARRREKAAMAVRLAVTDGTCLFDDVQLEYGREATGFTERQSQYLSLEMEGVPATDLPKYKLGRDAVKTLLVRNTSGKRLTGELKVFLDPWDKAGTTPIATKRVVDWEADATEAFPVDVGALAPDGYVILASFEPYFSEKGVYEPANTGWGAVGRSQLLKRNGLRFCVFAATEPKDLFGVGNGMIGHGGWWGGNSMENAVLGKSVHPVLLGEADPFKAAVVGAPNIEEPRLNIVRPEDRAFPESWNPTAPNMINAYSPNGRKVLRERAIAFGRRVADDPSVAGAKLENEGFFVNRGNFCPDAWGDLDFRTWAKQRYDGDLARLNAVWKTAFATWDEVVQPISGIKEGTIEKTGGAALDWMASLGKMTPEAQARLAATPAFSMDWFRWRADSVITLYADFIAAAKTVDRKTLYGNNYPWPNYFTHIIWPQWRTHDVIMLDQQYACGFPRTLGTNEEMIDILEQAESISRGERPIWGREIYFQPNYPGEMAALQNWAMIAHGMSVPMTFAWRPYADRNREVFKTGPKSWLLDDAPPMWFILDVDGSKVPGYAPNARSTDEIAAFHRKYDGLSLERIRGDVALYFSTDSSTYIMFETFDKPYDSQLSQDRMAIAGALRYAGSRIEYFDDATLAEVDPERFPVLFAAGEKVLSDSAEARLKRYAERGGRLVVFNDFNAWDVNLEPKANPGAEGWKGDVRVVKDFVGKYDTKPYNTAAYDQYIAKLLADLEIPRHAWWENETPHQDGEERLLAGEGRPIVEVVVRRQKTTGRRFVFVLNKGGAGRGRLCGPDFEGATTLVDALTEEQSGLALELQPFGYRVFLIP